MAQPTNTYATNDMVGIREDLADVIYNVSPFHQPFMSMIPHVKATSINHEWQTDALEAADDTNARIEGDDVTAEAATPTVRLGNYTQLSDRSVRVSSTAQAVKTAGRGNEMTYQKELKKAKVLKNDLEKILTSSKAKVGGDDSTARELAGMGAWVKTNTDKGTGGTEPTGDGTDTRGDASTANRRAFKESQLRKVLRGCYDNGGEPTVLMVGSYNRDVATTFQGRGTTVNKAEDKKLHASFDVYEGPFNQIKIIPNRFQRTRDAWVIDPKLWAFAKLQDFHSFDLQKSGHSDARVVACEYSLECRNELGSGLVADLTDA